MHRPTERRRRIAARLALIALIGLGALGALPASAQPLGLSAPPHTRAFTGGLILYLPLVRRGALVTPLQFASAIDVLGKPLDPATTFPYGITKLYASAVVTDGSGQFANILFISPGGSGTQGGKTLTSDEERVTVSITGSGGAPLARGTYTVRFSLNGSVSQERTVVIQ
jgi:hypothetical protein